MNRLSASCLCVALLAGCQSTVFERAPLAAEPCDTQLAGDWLSVGDEPADDGEVEVRIDAACKAEVLEHEASGTRRGDATTFTVGSRDGERYLWVDATWVQKRFEPRLDARPGDIHLLRYRLREGELTLWSADDAAIAHRIIDGELQGEVRHLDHRLENRLTGEVDPVLLDRRWFFDREAIRFRPRGGEGAVSVPAAVRIVEVGPRDGLQNEKTMLSAADKIALVDRLSATGLRSIEATSFVSPKWVPQLADAAEVFAGIRRRPGVGYPVLVPNLQGYERARAVGAEEVAVFTAASEQFNLRNTNAGIDESIERFRPVLEHARDDGVRVRGYVSTVLGCPYQGAVPLADVVRVAQRLHALGCYEVSLGDTIGIGTAGEARAMLAAVAEQVPLSALAVHFHDTRGQALANVYACLEEGVGVVDAAVGGTGGCPYARGASGNLATEDLVYMLDGLGIATGVNLPLLAETGRWLAALLGRETGSRVGRALA